jgi:hypothetical protein
VTLTAAITVIIVIIIIVVVVVVVVVVVGSFREQCISTYKDALSTGPISLPEACQSLLNS